MGMREIKFRAWLSDTENDENAGMIYSSKIRMVKFWKSFYDWTGNIKVLMQYTGLKDKNGREIYEGDIVEVVGKGFVGYYAKGIVEYNECFAEFIVRSLRTNNTYEMNCNHEYRVIGNVYENPELLKEASE